MDVETINNQVRNRRIRDDHFMVTATFLGGAVPPFALGAVVTIPITFQADSDFLVESTVMSAYTAPGVPAVAPDFLMFLFDSGSGRALSDAPVHVGNCTGTALWPFHWKCPRLFKGGGTMAVILSDLGGVQPITGRVDVTFIGRKIFYLAEYQRSI